METTPEINKTETILDAETGVKLINSADLAGIIQNQISREQDGIDLHDKLAKVLRDSFNGKKLTRRLVTKFKALLPENSVIYWKELAGMYSIEVWRYGCFDSMNNRWNALVAYDSDKKCYDAKIFEERDLCHGSAAKKRQETRLALLNDCDALETIAGNINQYNIALKNLNTAMSGPFDMPDYYDFRKLVEGREGK
tara:strand:+ start:61 stop:648 length:588 start_codon:yes stop_codon:yes gene_type:complete